MSSDSSDDNAPLENLIITSKKKGLEVASLRCFDVIDSSKRQALIRNFNKMKDRNEQNAYLCGLISMKDICRRRPRKDGGSARLRDKSHTYKVRIQHAEGLFEEMSVSQAAFISLHGIKNHRLCTRKWYMKIKGEVVPDGRGKHTN
ncbi:hypothetical protein ILUMI_19001 [Ignelater luminosus]|uniref:Uncharacterized protein n=1 Tax=Ignelater luminosus TaxID=2038154 RepID=A0A8K0G3L7_IGNLU|nr:hypothetical protein ILUMI_19001 [Ignelater luminosus]